MIIPQNHYWPNFLKTVSGPRHNYLPIITYLHQKSDLYQWLLIVKFEVTLLALLPPAFWAI